MGNKELSENEYRNMCRNRNRKQEQLTDAKRKNRILDEKIDRLYKAYKEIKEQYSNFEYIRKKEKKTLNETKRWKGNNFNNYALVGENLKNADYKFDQYINHQILDEINNEINRLKKQKYSDSFLGNLARAISDLNTSIRNYIN